MEEDRQIPAGAIIGVGILGIALVAFAWMGAETVVHTSRTEKPLANVATSKTGSEVTVREISSCFTSEEIGEIAIDAASRKDQETLKGLLESYRLRPVEPGVRVRIITYRPEGVSKVLILSGSLAGDRCWMPSAAVTQ